MKIAIVTRYNSENVNNWSGIPYFITHEIRKMSDDVVLINVEEKAWILKLTKLIEKLIKHLSVYNIDLSITSAYSKFVAKEIQEKINKFKPQIIVGIAASPELANIDFSVPFVHISDATYELLIDYYTQRTHVPRWLKREGNAIEQKILDKSSYAILPSQWAQASALKEYQTEPEKIKLIKMGANIAQIPNITSDYLAKKFEGQCSILFMGKDWKRKGGEILLDAFEILKNTNMDVRLNIVGCQPFRGEIPDGITVYPNIHKSDPEQFALYNRLFSEASFFVLPTRAEAYGLVFAEAAAFSTPVIAPKTGGIPSVVDDGKSGILLPLEAGGKEYAKLITDIWSDKTKLYEIGKYAHKKYCSELNWDTWRGSFSALLADLPEQP